MFNLFHGFSVSVLNVFREDDSTLSVGSMFQCLTTLTVGGFLLTLSEISGVSVSPLHLVTGHHGNEFGSICTYCLCLCMGTVESQPEPLIAHLR